MTKLPKNFPEYSLMYKTLNKKIVELKEKFEKSSDPLTREKIKEDISKYQNESDRIKSLFPENFF
jgi:hypothetical protein